ncbi:protein DJ-1 homolog B-like isoform X2 [Magnolia sinica]|uniref:protein DJ-1 homolog B-like isoform X2 n=1 Tax=Magnolia sinica TaxID=86752 RepID=UPI0026597A76|nr:protein DJ-1 homolog B-like isoform X2 [Magnolia sinica]
MSMPAFPQISKTTNPFDLGTEPTPIHAPMYESNAWFVRWSTMCSKLSDQSEAKNRVLVDGKLITSRGTSMELSLAIVEKLFGCEKALDLAVNENFK